MFKWRRLYSYFLAALAFSALVIFLVAYARRWNQPNTAPVTIYDGAVVNGTTPLQVKITCDCPEAFVVPGTQNIRLTVSVKPQQSAAIQPQQAPQIQPKQGPPLPAGKSTTSAQSTPVPMNVWVWLDPSSISLVDPADTTAKWINFSLG